jgi:Fur family iron response transcriptional regulator
VEKKILKLISVKEGKAIFCTNMKNHYHFFNSKTGKLTDIPYEKIKIKKLPKPPKGTKIDNIEITINLNTKS